MLCHDLQVICQLAEQSFNETYELDDCCVEHDECDVTSLYLLIFLIDDDVTRDLLAKLRSFTQKKPEKLLEFFEIEALKPHYTFGRGMKRIAQFPLVVLKGPLNDNDNLSNLCLFILWAFAENQDEIVSYFRLHSTISDDWPNFSFSRECSVARLIDRKMITHFKKVGRFTPSETLAFNDWVYESIQYLYIKCFDPKI